MSSGMQQVALSLHKTSLSVNSRMCTMCERTYDLYTSRTYLFRRPITKKWMMNCTCEKINRGLFGRCNHYKYINVFHRNHNQSTIQPSSKYHTTLFKVTYNPLQSNIQPSSKYHTTLFKVTYNPLQSTTPPSSK